MFLIPDVVLSMICFVVLLLLFFRYLSLVGCFNNLLYLFLGRSEFDSIIRTVVETHTEIFRASILIHGLCL